MNKNGLDLPAGFIRGQIDRMNCPFFCPAIFARLFLPGYFCPARVVTAMRSNLPFSRTGSHRERLGGDKPRTHANKPVKTQRVFRLCWEIRGSRPLIRRFRSAVTPVWAIAAGKTTAWVDFGKSFPKMRPACRDALSQVKYGASRPHSVS